MKHIITLLLVGIFAGCQNSAVAPEPVTTTVGGGFELTVKRGTSATWTHTITLPAGSWTSADFVACSEYRAISLRVGPCESTTVRLQGDVVTFSGTVGGTWTDKISARWEASTTP